MALFLLVAAWVAPARAADEGHAVRLPEGAAGICAGRGGKLLIFHLKNTKQLAVVDVTKAKIVHAFEMPSDDICFAANADSLFVAFTAQKLLHRYSLATFKREEDDPARSPAHPPQHGQLLDRAADGDFRWRTDDAPRRANAASLRRECPDPRGRRAFAPPDWTNFFVTFTAGRSPCTIQRAAPRWSSLGQ